MKRLIESRDATDDRYPIGLRTRLPRSARTRNLLLAVFAAYSLVVALIFAARSYGLVPLLAVGAITLAGYLPLARWAATRLR